MKLLIELEIEGDTLGAYAVVRSLLDAGYIQDLVNQHRYEDVGELRVTAAHIKSYDGVRAVDAG